jgi:hypothetical protein
MEVGRSAIPPDALRPECLVIPKTVLELFEDDKALAMANAPQHCHSTSGNLVVFIQPDYNNIDRGIMPAIHAN